MDFYWPILKRIEYLFLPHNHIWNRLDNPTKEMIRKSNQFHNNSRADFSGKEIYGKERKEGGCIWDNFKLNINEDDPYMRFFNDCNKTRISRDIDVLEIGPGGGYYTRYILETNNVSSYIGLEISTYFADYLNQKLSRLNSNYIINNCDSLEGLKKLKDESIDLIIINSTLHHLTDRKEIFLELDRVLRVEGKILLREPCHYIPRIIDLLGKCLFNNYLSKDEFCNFRFISTHQFCTVGEIKNYCKKISSLKLSKIDYIFGKNKLYRKLFGKYVSSELMVEITKVNHEKV
tara:strand:- start:354 stop:1223 length:870 start_codon:yes stop_codon:yes gene_type:complete